MIGVKIRRCILEVGEDPPRGLTFWCPACNEAHLIRVDGPGAWTWNGNELAPTFDPSVKCEHEKLTVEGEAMIDRGEPPNITIVVAGIERRKYPTAPYCCHSVVTDGMIRFCGDCTHALVNQTVPLPDWPEPTE